LDPAAGGVIKPTADLVQLKENQVAHQSPVVKKPAVSSEPDTDRTPVDEIEKPPPAAARKSGWLLIVLFAVLGLGALGYAGYQTLRKERRLLQTVLLGAGPAAAPIQGGLKGVAVSKAAEKRPASVTGCARNSSQTISSVERDQLLLDVALAFEKGRAVRAQELLRRYVQEACDNATLEALTILMRQHSASEVGPGK